MLYKVNRVVYRSCMVKVGDLIKHIKFVDVACLVQEVHGSWLLIQWVNLGYNKSWLIPIDVVGIRPNFKNWRKCALKQDYQCYRNAEWTAI